jgi:hypothetical protein
LSFFILAPDNEIFECGGIVEILWLNLRIASSGQLARQQCGLRSAFIPLHWGRNFIR